MSAAYDALCSDLRSRPRRWLVTGAAGFIGSNILQKLLELDQSVVGLDNFSTGYRHNLDDVRNSVSAGQWKRFRFIEGDIRDLETCREASSGVQFVLHQAALGSVPRSIEDPLLAHTVNVNGFLTMLIAGKDAGIERFVYASSSSVYGDDPALPKSESSSGNLLSPYAATKHINEVYADVFQRCYGTSVLGLRYFNVFGPRQDPSGAYAAVIPRWFDAAVQRQPIEINGDGETTRDFCYIANAVQSNILAALAPADAAGQVYNVAVAERTSLNQLATLIIEEVRRLRPQGACDTEIRYLDFRPGDIRHSLADISLAEAKLGYVPSHNLLKGLREASEWYLRHQERATVIPEGHSI